MHKIFLVDDDPLILKSTARLLRNPDYEIVPFESAEAATEALVGAPSIIVTDYHLMGLDGLVLLETAKAKNPAVRTVLLSGDDSDAPIAEALKTGVVDRFLGKPWNPDELRGLISALLSL
jgi:DNA-binding response OmpR family regulator